VGGSVPSQTFLTSTPQKARGRGLEQQLHSTTQSQNQSQDQNQKRKGNPETPPASAHQSAPVSWFPLHPLLPSRQITQNETAQHGLITQLERLGSDTSPAADAMRQRITDQFTDRYNQAKTLQAELDDLTASQPAEDDPTLINELPYAAAAFTSAPDHIKAKLYAAFGIQVLYRQDKNQATIWATITTTTPGIVATLASDPRTDNDTACGDLTNAPIRPERPTMTTMSDPACCAW
jgi:hypothetical protein